MESPQPKSWRKLPPPPAPARGKEGAGPLALAYFTFTCSACLLTAWRALRVLRGEGLIKGSNKIIILNRMKYLCYKKKKKSQQSLWDGSELDGDCTRMHTLTHMEMGDSNLIPGQSSPTPSG